RQKTHSLPPARWAGTATFCTRSWNRVPPNPRKQRQTRAKPSESAVSLALRGQKAKDTRELPDLFPVELFEDCRGAGDLSRGRRLHCTFGAQRRGAHSEPI